MYNLFSSEDENEFYYAANVLGLNSKKIEVAKKYYYTLSFCTKDNLNNTYLWKEYGKNYSGVALEFSIDNDPMHWNKYMISNVYYELSENFRKFQKDLSKIKNSSGVNFQLNIDSLLFFHMKQMKKIGNFQKLNLELTKKTEGIELLIILDCLCGLIIIQII